MFAHYMCENCDQLDHIASISVQSRAPKSGFSGWIALRFVWILLGRPMLRRQRWVKKRLQWCLTCFIQTCYDNKRPDHRRSRTILV
ncbi:hypothetical protein BASA61_004677 [Batrachochytrium salamandrivorans]|nr:hypothetical protein BASA61_004677 [Batrachochytrium salamandrivorans]KAH9265781.1 hypothetical protein BASA84_001431 [Batrachochytrium salamandrivorans]